MGNLMDQTVTDVFKKPKNYKEIDSVINILHPSKNRR